MLDIRRLDDTLSVSPQIRAIELAEIAERGFRSVINNRPDRESSDQPDSAGLACMAESVGLDYRHIPVVAGAITTQSVAQFRAALDALPGPILAFCRSGTRSATLWALANSGQRPPTELIQTAKAAGYALDNLRAQLVEHAP